MKTFDIKAQIGDNEQTFTIQQESSTGFYLVTRNQKFVSRLFRESDGRWKSMEISDLSPSDINSIGTEIELYLDEQEREII